MTRDEMIVCIHNELDRHFMPRTHENAQRLIASVLTHLEMKPETGLTAALIRSHADLQFVAQLDTELPN